MTVLAVVLAISVGLLLWTWAGYPLLMALLGRLRAGPAIPRAVSVHVSAIVATRDEATSVAERVADLLASAWPEDALEVIIALDASTPAARRPALHALGAGRVRVVTGDEPGGKAAALNAGVRAASGEVLVFTDTQQRFEPDAIGALVAALQADPRRDVVGGALHLPGDRPGMRRSPVEWYWAMERALRTDEARVHSTIGVSGSIYAMWRRAWVGLPAGLILDDVYVPMRAVLAGRRVGYEPRARAWDVRRTSAAQEQGRKVRTLTGNYQLMAWLPGLLNPFRNPVWFQFVCHKTLRLLTPWLALAAAASAAAMATLAWPRGVAAILAGALACMAIAALAAPRLVRMARTAVAWGWAANGALAQATVNGLRRRWDVWS
jgi:cellulose synthase/poly-beta-1,6-N-acetylglucosamine synthase-like glycosyltransferase